MVGVRKNIMFWNKIASGDATNIADVLLKVFSGFTLANVEMLFQTEVSEMAPVSPSCQETTHPSPAHICHRDANWRLLFKC